jgi:hypothetical protein
MIGVIFVVLLITFLTSLFVIFFRANPTERAVQFADFAAKGQFGVFIGAVMTYLGIKA